MSIYARRYCLVCGDLTLPRVVDTKWLPPGTEHIPEGGHWGDQSRFCLDAYVMMVKLCILCLPSV